MFKSKKTSVRMMLPEPSVRINEHALESVFDECDRYDVDETGGRLIGFYRRSRRRFVITVGAVIGPGPDAYRTHTSIFQDGQYQEAVFRKFESKYPRIEHLGNWHTHHVNGLATLSNGDIETYNRIVNHKNHNTDFFYALLVVAKNQGQKDSRRYSVRHFIIHRGSATVHQIPASNVRIVRGRALEISEGQTTGPEESSGAITGGKDQSIANRIRLEDKRALAEIYPHMKPFLSRRLDSLYWRGKLDLIDGSSVEVLVLERVERGTPSYTITLTGSYARLFQSTRLYAKSNFESARKAIRLFERDLNRELFSKAKS